MSCWSLVGDDGQPIDDFRFDDQGRIVEDLSVATEILLVLDNHLGQWWANPEHGSRLASLMAGDPPPDLHTALISATREALAPLEREGRLRDIQVNIDMAGNRARVSISVHDVSRGAQLLIGMELP